MSLPWAPRGHVALASSIFEGTHADYGPISGVWSADNSSIVSFIISMVNVYPCPWHTREGDRNLDVMVLHKVHVTSSGTTSSTPTSHTGDLQVECRIPSNFRKR